MTIEQLLAEKGGIRLDIACGNLKQPGFVGLDVQPLPGVDIVWDVNKHPWPIPDDCVIVAVCSHLVEHIPPIAFKADGSTWYPFLEFMNECWRIMKLDAQIAISHPHGWSQGYLQDPTHCHAMSEDIWGYFSPEFEGGRLYQFYKPKPWNIENLYWDPSFNVEVVLRKRAE